MAFVATEISVRPRAHIERTSDLQRARNALTDHSPSVLRTRRIELQP